MFSCFPNREICVPCHLWHNAIDATNSGSVSLIDYIYWIRNGKVVLINACQLGVHVVQRQNMDWLIRGSLNLWLTSYIPGTNVLLGRGIRN